MTKKDKNSEFKTIDRTLDKHIREHCWNEMEFKIEHTDSTSPFDTIIAEIREPDMEYYFVLNIPERTDRMRAKGWFHVSSDRLQFKRNFRTKEENDIVTGDTVLMERPMRFGDRERAMFDIKSSQVVKDALQKVKTDVYNIDKPFSHS